MELSEEEFNTLYDSFEKRWPIEFLKNMTLEEYTNLKEFSEDYFCYWVETKTKELALIKGSTSYKFGIFRYNKAPDIKRNGYLHDEKYAWQERYGKTADEAYSNIRSIIIKIATYAKEAAFEEIEKIDLSEMFKWKIAFLYSNKKLLNWFSRDALLLFARKFNFDIDDKTPTYKLQKFLMTKKEAKSYTEFGKELLPLWYDHQEEQKKKIQYWYVGHNFGSNVPQLSRFLEENIWEGRFDEEKDKAQLNECLKINEGDILLYKSTFTKGSNHDKPCMRISAVAKVISKQVKKENGWIAVICNVTYINTSPTDFEGNKYGQYRKTIHECKDMEIISYANGEDEMKIENINIENSKNLLLNTHNLILHGAPGTGKTHLAKEIAESMGAEWEMLQFHPSYDYTDFVEGLRPVNNGEQIGFERKDGVFKKFCEKALRNLVDSDKSVETLKEEKSIEDKVNDFIDNAISSEQTFQLVNKNTFTIVENLEDKIFISAEHIRLDKLPVSKKDILKIINRNIILNDVKDVRQIHTAQTRQQQDSYVYVLCNEIRKIKNTSYTKVISKIEKKPFIFIIDEINRGEISKIFGELFFSIDPGYRGKEGLIKTQYQNLVEEGDIFYDGFYVPENVYIIGTMNDIDRSVESMDFVFRRRFAFKEIKANENLGMLDELDESIREKAEKTLKSLNKAIWDEESKSGIEGLSSAYHIGGAYFLKLKELGNDFDKLWEYHLEGLLREYLRGMEDAESNLEKLHTAYINGQEA